MPARLEQHKLCRLLARLNRVLYRRAEAVISLGEVMTQRLAAAGAPPERLHTVHNWTPGEGVTASDWWMANRPESVALGR